MHGRWTHSPFPHLLCTAFVVPTWISTSALNGIPAAHGQSDCAFPPRSPRVRCAQERRVACEIQSGARGNSETAGNRHGKKWVFDTAAAPRSTLDASSWLHSLISLFPSPRRDLPCYCWYGSCPAVQRLPALPQQGSLVTSSGVPMPVYSHLFPLHHRLLSQSFPTGLTSARWLPRSTPTMCLCLVKKTILSAKVSRCHSSEALTCT